MKEHYYHYLNIKIGGIYQQEEILIVKIQFGTMFHIMIYF